MATRNRTARRARARNTHSSFLPNPFSRELQLLEKRLEDIHAVVATAIAALKAQAADADCDVAHCLRRGALEPLREEVERLQATTKRSPRRD